MAIQHTLRTWISPLADRLASDLIRELQIQSGHGLALYLDVDRVFDNHKAVSVWVQRVIDRSIETNPDFCYDLKHLLMGVLP